MMQSTNNKCNALESIFGIFLHASNTPSKVIETLAHMGITISPDAIDNAVRSISLETYGTFVQWDRHSSLDTPTTTLTSIFPE
jgi:hypothetical protein